MKSLFCQKAGLDNRSEFLQAMEVPFKLLNDTSRFSLTGSDLLAYSAIEFWVSGTDSVPVLLELQSIESIIDLNTEVHAKLQRVDRFYPVGYWKDISRRKQELETGRFKAPKQAG